VKGIFRVEETTYLSTERFQWLFEELILSDCFIQNWTDTLESIKKNKVLYRYLKGNKRTKGVQTIFRYEKNGKIIIIITTYDTRTGTAKRTGSGWVIIIDPRTRKPFFWFPLRRTRYFIERILSVAKLMIDIVEYWPRCPECSVDLTLVQVSGFVLMRAFTCLNKLFKHRHVRPYFYITAMYLPEKQRSMLQARFDDYYMRRRDDEEKGIHRQYAVIIRSERNEQKDKISNTETVYHDLQHESKNGETIYYNDGAHIE